MKDIIIIGAGTAGMTAAIYAVRAGKTVLILEQENFGGQIIFSPRVENYPSIKQISGSEFANNLFEQATSLGVEVELEKVTKIVLGEKSKTVVTEDGEHECKAVILATGVKHRKLGIDSEEKFIGSGVSYCAVCDGAFFKGKDVAVVGGGNTALQDAMFLSTYCNKVYLIHRRNEFRGELNLVEKLKEKENIHFVLDSTVAELKGDDTLNSIIVTNVKTNEQTELNIEGLFVAIGNAPENSAFKDLIELDETGFIKAGEDCKTTQSGIFTAGDCRTKEVRQLTTAAADGTVSALEACKYIDAN